MSSHEHYQRLLAFGDIHGCYKQLKDLLHQVTPTSEDWMIFLGDYIDRGPNSCEVVDLLLFLKQDFPQTQFLRGNHEQMLQDYLEGKDSWGFLMNGGRQTLASYGSSSNLSLPPDHQAFLKSLKLYHETNDFIFVHAGLRPGVPLEEQQEEDLLWIRQEFLNSDYSWNKTIVFGHTPQQSPLIRRERLGLDTGAVYGRQLTCCDVLSRTFWHA